MRYPQEFHKFWINLQDFTISLGFVILTLSDFHISTTVVCVFLGNDQTWCQNRELQIAHRVVSLTSLSQLETLNKDIFKKLYYLFGS